MLCPDGDRSSPDSESFILNIVVVESYMASPCAIKNFVAGAVPVCRAVTDEEEVTSCRWVTYLDSWAVLAYEHRSGPVFMGASSSLPSVSHIAHGMCISILPNGNPESGVLPGYT
jgi:hypothetical protein